MKKSKLNFLFLMFIALGLFSQAPTWQWAKKLTGPYNDYGRLLKSDKAGNQYLAGYFGSWLSYGTTTINSSGNSDCYIAKFDQNGNIIKIINFGSSASFSGADERIMAMDFDQQNNLYISGYYNTNNFVVGTYTLNSNNGVIFYAKLDSSLNVLWAKSIKCGQVSNTGCLKVDTLNSCFYLGGYYPNGTVIDTYTLPSGEFLGGYTIIKFDLNGNHIWWNKFNTSAASSPGFNDIEIDDSGNLMITGINFGTTVFGSTTLTPQNSIEDAFLLKVSKNDGKAVWVLPFKSTTTMDFLNSIAKDKQGNFYVGGSFGGGGSYSTGTLIAGNFSIATTTYGQFDTYVAKVDSGGNISWLKKYGANQEDRLYQLEIDNTQHPIITGKFYNFFVMGTITLNSISASYVAKIDPNGNPLWVIQSGNNSQINSLSIDKFNQIYTCGEFIGTSYFGSHSVTNYTVYGSSMSDIFYAKINNSVPTSIENINNMDFLYHHIYPNPAKDVLYLNNLKGCEIKMFDLKGNCVYDFILESDNTEINLTHYNPGLYLIQVRGNNRFEKIKILIE
ncbi:MAG: T9SS type A sorting domain-containing protein [Bacteroidia bacterium]|nr:T9SS type A sorting domain-containing protein [Bacteroidia bacterium]